jgi:hypothetical protein
VPYSIAPLWDAGLARQSTERQARAAAHKAAAKKTATSPSAPGIVPKELRDKLKRSRGAKGLLMDLESLVRDFVADWEEKERTAREHGFPAADPDSEDDEIVFVGRNGVMNDEVRTSTSSSTTTTTMTVGTTTETKKELKLFETPEGDVGGCFGRWLVHHIGVYYGLRTWSVTVGDPARREAYVGVRNYNATRSSSGGGGEGDRAVCTSLPRPLYGLV